MNHGLRVGIVGGGPGGLLTAYLLQKYAARPMHLTVFEASGRLGGKVLTSRFAAGVPYEAGAAELYDYSHHGDDSLRELVAELGLPAVRMEGAGAVVGGDLVTSVDHVRRHLGKAAAAAYLDFDRKSRDALSPREFYHADDPALNRHRLAGPFRPWVDAIADEKARHFVEALMHSDLATEPERTNAEYGLHNYLMNDPRYLRLYSVEGGNERLVKELAARAHADYRMNHPVGEIGRDADGRMFVSATDGDGRATFETFDRVVVALPHAALRRVSFGGDLLGAAMQRHIGHYDHPAHYLRVTALFDRPFWRSRFPDSFVMLDAFGGCCLYDESCRRPGAREGVLGWLISGSAAEAMSEWDDARLTAAALDSLPDFLAAGRVPPREVRVHRWVGEVSAMPGGLTCVPLDLRHRPEPKRHADFFVVGDYLFDSTLNGVLESADYVARWIASSQGSRNEHRNDRHGRVAGRGGRAGRAVRGPGLGVVAAG